MELKYPSVHLQRVHPSLPALLYQSLPAVMSPPPLLSVTVKERVPIIVTVNTTTDAGIAVTTPDLTSEGWAPPPTDMARVRLFI